jgi:hypothetical protein
VCKTCLYIIANGEYNDGEDTAERISAAMAERFPGEVRDLCAGGPCTCGNRKRDVDCDCDDLGFCKSACDTCGDTDHGDRYAATLLRRLVWDVFSNAWMPEVEWDRMMREMRALA